MSPEAAFTQMAVPPNQFIQNAQGGSFSLTFSGPFTTPQACTVNYFLVGNQVTLDFSATSGAASASGQASATSSAGIPSLLRPPTSIPNIIQIVSNSLILDQVGACSIASNGVVTITNDLVGSVLWAILGNNGWKRFTTTYLLV